MLKTTNQIHDHPSKKRQLGTNIFTNLEPTYQPPSYSTRIIGKFLKRHRFRTTHRIKYHVTFLCVRGKPLSFHSPIGKVFRKFTSWIMIIKYWVVCHPRTIIITLFNIIPYIG